MGQFGTSKKPCINWNLITCELVITGVDKFDNYFVFFIIWSVEVIHSCSILFLQSSLFLMPLLRILKRRTKQKRVNRVLLLLTLHLQVLQCSTLIISLSLICLSCLSSGTMFFLEHNFCTGNIYTSTNRVHEFGLNLRTK